MPDEVTRGEFDLLKQMVTENQRRVESIDASGTKGVAVVQAQLTDLTKDVTRSEIEMNKRFDAHDLVHKQDARDRVSAKRWMVGTIIAFMMLLVAMLTILIQVLQHVH